MGDQPGSKRAVDPQSQAQLAGLAVPDNAFFLRRVGIHRIGARAFLHLGELCGPETAIRSWLCGREFSEADDRPPSRFSSEIGTKADAKQQIEGFCVRVSAN